MFRRSLALSLAAAAVASLGLASAAPAASGPYPTIRSVAPKKVAIGQTLTIRGSHFRKGKNRNTVVFKRDGGRAVFVRATGRSSSRITLVVPSKLLPFFVKKSGKAQPTRFRLRVLAKRFGQKFTSRKLTPLIRPVAPGTPGTPGTPSTPPVDTDRDGVPDVQDADDDNDGLADALEISLKMRPDSPDSDGDDVTDGFEYNSAKDLNNAAVPYPGKRPYPNPLDGGDSKKDFDGDGLELGAEHRAWAAMGKPIPYSYSDGTKWSRGNAPALEWRDDNRDVDQDGLTNGAESDSALVGPMNQKWWVMAFDGTNGPKEIEYYGPGFLDTAMTDADTDGDGIKDGADDQDHDGYPNWFEVERPLDWECTYVSYAHPYGSPSSCGDGITHDDPLARVQPFNPCKPIHSLACHSAIPFGYYKDEPDWDTPVRSGDPGTDPPANVPPALHQ